jgi:hypothetical protein
VSKYFENLTKEQVLREIEKDAQAIKHIEPEWLADKDVALSFLNNVDIYEDVGYEGSVYDLGYSLDVKNYDRIKDDYLKHLVKEYFPIQLEYLDPVLRKDKDVVMAAVSKFGLNLEFASDELKDDKDVVMAAVRNYGFSVYHASDRLKEDDDVILEAAKSDFFTLSISSKKNITDKGFLLKLIEKYNERTAEIGTIDFIFPLKEAASSFLNDKEILISAAKVYPALLKELSDRLKNDKDIVMVAVSNDGFALNYASNRLKNDKDIVMVAVSNDGCALNYASDRLKNDKDIVMAAVSNNHCALNYASDRLKDDIEVFMADVSKLGETFEYASDRLRDNEELVMAAFQSDESVFSKITIQHVFASVGEKLSNNGEFLNKALEIEPDLSLTEKQEALVREYKLNKEVNAFKEKVKDIKPTEGMFKRTII